MNRAQRRAKNTAWKVKQRLNPPQAVAVPRNWRKAMKAMMSQDIGTLMDNSFIRLLLDQHETEGTPATTPGSDQGCSPEATGETCLHDRLGSDEEACRLDAR
jgi:hypothetical protein